MTDATAEREVLFGRLADEYVDRLKRGESPSADEYTARYPEVADLIRDGFPLLRMLGSQAPPLAEPPARFGEFRVLRIVGRGAMGVVYEAVQEPLGRHVALKVLPGHAALEPAAIERFRREARTAAALHHTNIVPVFAVGQQDDTPYYAMQLIDGRGLDAVLCAARAGLAAGSTAREEVPQPAGELARSLLTGQFAAPPVSAAEGGSPTTSTSGQPSNASLGQSGRSYFRTVARLGVQAAEALAYAHKQGVLHRDVKPSNLLLDAQGTLWVTDFGLAKATESDDLTRSGDLVGTLRYMAPERFAGPGDARSDVYSLGATLYEVATLKPAFDEPDRPRLLERIRNGPLIPPRRVAPGVPRDLETTILKAMAREPRDRYSSAAALADDLRRFLADEPIRARRAPAWERAVKWARRRPAVAALLSAIVLVSAVGLAGVTWQWRRAEATAQELERRLYFYRIAVAEREMAANNMRLADDLLNDCPDRLRGWEWHYVRRLRYGSRPPLEGHTSAVHSVAVHPDGRLLASAGEDKTVRIWDLTTNTARTLGGHTNQVRVVAFSPDGRFLASAGLDGKLFVWSTDDWQKVREWNEGQQIGSLVFHLDGQRLAWRDWENGAIKFGDIATGIVTSTRCAQARESPSRVLSIACSADGRRLAGARGNIMSGDGQVVVWDLNSEAELFTLQGPIGAMSVAFSPDGRYLAAAGGTMWRGESEVIVWDARTGREIHRIRGTSGMAQVVAFSPDSRRLATAGRDKIIKLWDMDTGLEGLALHGHTDSVRALAFSRDGKRLFSGSADQTVRIWDATPLEETPRPEIITLTGHAGRLSSVAYRPDGLYFASAGLDGLVTIWDARTHRLVRTLPKHDGGVLSVAFSCDSRLLASTGDDGTVRIWDAQTWEELSSPPKYRSWISSAAFSPDGRLALTGSLSGAPPGSTISLWNSKTGTSLPAIHNAHTWFIQCVAFSPDGRWLASTAADGKVKVWDGKTSQLVREISPPRKGRGTCVAFSPDSQRLAYAGLNKTVTILEVSTWRELAVFDKHTDQINAVAFSPDGRRVASASNDATIKVWNAATGEVIATLRGHDDWVESVAFRPDGEELISGGWDRTVKVWKAPP